MYFQSLNSPALKKIRNKVKYSCFIDKSSDLLTKINHTTHKTLIPTFNHDIIKSSENNDKIGDKYIVTISDDGFLQFKEDNYILYRGSEFKAVGLSRTSSTKKYIMFVMLNTITGEIIGGLTFNYNNNKYTANDDGLYYLEEELS